LDSGAETKRLLMNEYEAHLKSGMTLKGTVKRPIRGMQGQMLLLT